MMAATAPRAMLIMEKVVLEAPLAGTADAAEGTESVVESGEI